MLVCTKCGYVASQDSEDWARGTDTLYLGELGYKIENYLCCPECGSGELTETQECEHCGEHFDPDRLVVVKRTCPPDDEYPYETEEVLMVCPDCYEEHYFKEEDL